MSVKRGKKPTPGMAYMEGYKPAIAVRIALPVLAAIVNRELVEAY